MGKLIDLTGKKFEHLTVRCRGEDLIKKNGKKEPRWLCECDCGNPDLVLVLGYNLKNGNTSSCGCVHKLNGSNAGKKYGKINGRKNKKYNKYELSGEYGIGYTLKNEPFYFDLKDYDKIKNYCWYIDDNGYVLNKTDEGYISMHRLVMGLENGDKREVDHIYHHKNDNRKLQLRIVTSSQNKMNKDKQSNNTSGTRGVSYHFGIDKWIAEIRLNYNKIYLGAFNTKEEAIKVRKEAEEKYFGEYNYKEKGDSTAHDNS